MGYSFNGITKVVSLTQGTTTLDVRDFYSRWKEWFLASGSNFNQAFSVVGGDPVDETAGIYVSSYFYLLNGWKVKPQEDNHTLKVENGTLLTIEGDNPFVPTDGYYTVSIDRSLPIMSETINLGGGGATTTEIWDDVGTKISSQVVYRMVSISSQIKNIPGATDYSPKFYEISSQIKTIPGATDYVPKFTEISSQLTTSFSDFHNEIDVLINRVSRGM